MNKKIRSREDDLIKYLIRFMYLFLGLVFGIYLVLQISIQKQIRQVDEMLAKYDTPVKAERISVEDQMWHYIHSLPKPKQEILATNKVNEEFIVEKSLIEEIEEDSTINLDGAVEVNFRTSAYCPCIKCCGKTDGITASGTMATEWHTVAAGEDYPFGTKIYIPELKDELNGGWFEVEDRGGAISNEKLDVFFETHEKAILYGIKKVTAYVYFPE